MFADKGDEYRTGNYALATVLATLGFPWSFAQPCTNTYRDGERPKRGKDGRLEKLGRVIFSLDRRSAEFPEAKIDDVISTYDGEGRPGKDLDAELAKAAPDIAEVRRLLPLAIAEGCRNALANLREVKEAPHRVPATIVFRKENGMPIIIPENASEELQERWGVRL